MRFHFTKTKELYSKKVELKVIVLAATTPMILVIQEIIVAIKIYRMYRYGKKGGGNRKSNYYCLDIATTFILESYC